MALPTSSISCPSARGLTFRYSQVGAGSQLGGRNLGLLRWRRRCHWGSQTVSSVKIMAKGRKEDAGIDDESERPKLKLDRNDLLELKFGAMLGESHQDTLAKVIGRKVNPEASYIDIEKKPIKKIQEKPVKKIQGSPSSDIREAEFSRLLNQESRPNSQSAVSIYKPAKPASQGSDNLPEILKPPSRQSSPSSDIREAEFSRLLNQEGRPNAQSPVSIYKPAKPTSQSSDNLPEILKPPSRPGQPLPQAPRRTPSTNSAKTRPASQAKKALPLITFGPGGFTAQSNKPSAEVDDYSNLVQRPGVPSPDSIKPSWPKNDAVPPMLFGKSKKAVESVDDSLLRKPTPGDKNVASKPSSILDSEVVSSGMKDPKVPLLTGKPSQTKPNKKLLDRTGSVLASPSPDISEERFAKLLELAGSTEEDQTSTSSINTSKPKVTTRLGPKPVLIAKPPLEAVETREIVRGDDLMSSDPAAAMLEINAEPTDSDAESGLDLGRIDEKPTTGSATPDNEPSDPEQAILMLVKKASRISPARPPNRFPQAVPEIVKAKILDPVSSESDRLAGWSDQVKAAVKRSEAALPKVATQAVSETAFDQLLQRKAELRQRPALPPTPAISPDPAEVSLQQRYTSRPAAPSLKPPPLQGNHNQK